MNGVAVATIAALVLSGAPKHALTVDVSGNGRVTSRPAGIDCPSRCILRFTEATKVELTATPKRGSRFSGWSKPCGRTRTCLVRMTGAKRVRAVFVAIHPPRAKAGHYTGTYSDGQTFRFDVVGASVTNLVFDFNGHCATGSLAGPLTSVNGTFPIGPGGAVSGHIALNYPNATGTADFAGTLAPSGSGSGTLAVTVDFTNGSGTCTSTGTWSAHT